MFRCLICGKRHYKGSVPAQLCHSTNNPDYVAYLVQRHSQGFHGKGTGGHVDCPSCRGAKPEQLQFPLQMFIPAIEPKMNTVESICGCQG